MMVGAGRFDGFWTLFMMVRIVRLMPAMVRIERDGVNRMNIASAMGVRSRRRRHAIKRKRNDKQRRQNESQNQHIVILYRTR